MDGGFGEDGGLRQVAVTGAPTSAPCPCEDLPGRGRRSRSRSLHSQGCAGNGLPLVVSDGHPHPTARRLRATRQHRSTRRRERRRTRTRTGQARDKGCDHKGQDMDEGQEMVRLFPSPDRRHHARDSVTTAVTKGLGLGGQGTRVPCHSGGSPSMARPAARGVVFGRLTAGKAHKIATAVLMHAHRSARHPAAAAALPAARRSAPPVT